MSYKQKAFRRIEMMAIALALLLAPALQFRIDPRDQTMWKNMVDEWFATRQRIGEECTKLTNDPEFIRKVVQGGT